MKSAQCKGQKTFLQEPGGKYSRLYRPDDLCHNYSTLPSELESTHKQYMINRSSQVLINFIKSAAGHGADP